MISFPTISTEGTEKYPAVFSIVRWLKITCDVDVPISIPTLNIFECSSILTSVHRNFPRKEQKTQSRNKFLL